ncbi:glycosyltransferase family 4 protein [Polaromonas aquatica]|uniref:glycosyltransferase family 4 protein n=1 Tax=Polaromonas aquatica TaxID=332657 RepID=UPI003D6595A5
MHVCFVLTTPFALNAFVAPAIRALLARGDRVTVVVNADSGPIAKDIYGRIEIVNLEIARAIALLHDLAALHTLFDLFRARRFDVVHSVTPKAGLLAMMAARLAGISVRIHTFTGQVWATRSGTMRWLLRSIDRLLAACASSLLVDSASQRDFLVAENIVAPGRLHVLGEGSIAGVDTVRFAPQPQWRAEVRSQLGVPEQASLLLYIGRMHVEKGLLELAQAFAELALRDPAVHLLLVGPDEGALQPALTFAGAARERVHVVGLTSEPQKYMAAADIFCLASYREGFGLSLIEAAAAGLPCVASRIYGITDAVVEGETGLLVPARDVPALTGALEQLLGDPVRRAELGAAARLRAQRQFSQPVVVAAWLEFYDHQLRR